MENSDTTWLWVGAFIVLLALGLTLAALYWLGRRWQRQASTNLKPIISDLRRYQAEHRRLTAESQAFSPHDPPPYGQQAAKLRVDLQQASEHIALLGQHYVTAQSRLQSLPSNQLQAIVESPVLWTRSYNLAQAARHLQEHSRSVEESLKSADNTLNGLKLLPWLAAQQVREAYHTLDLARQGLARLRGTGLQGNSLQAAESAQEQLKAEFNALPVYLLEAPQDDLLHQAGKHDALDWFKLLASAAPRAARLLGQSTLWEKQHSETLNKVQAMQQEVAAGQALFDEMPSSLVLDEQAALIKSVEDNASQVVTSLAGLDIDKLSEAGQQADQARADARSLAITLKQSQRELLSLEKVLHDLGDRQGLLTAQIAALGKSPTYPLIWNVTRAQFAELRKRSQALGSPHDPRALIQVTQTLSTAHDLLAESRQMAAGVQEKTRQHAELLNLLGGTELKNGSVWCSEGLQLASQAAQFDPANWPAADGVAELIPALQKLQSRFQELEAQDPTSPLPETELLARLDQARQLSQDSRRLRERLGRVRLRLDELLQQENAARESLQDARNLLTQVGSLLNSNPSLKEIAGVEHDRLRTLLEGTHAGLAQRRRGLLPEKTAQVNAQTAQVEQAANQWLAQLNQEIEVIKREMADRVQSLAQIAILEEKAVQQAQELLAEDAPASSPARQRMRPAHRIADLLGQLKPRSDIWQRCSAYNRELADLERQLVDVHQAAIERYQQVRELLKSSEQLIPIRRGWPPTSTSLVNERTEFDRLELEWQRMEKQPGRATWVVRQLSDFAYRSQMILERVRQMLQRAEQEQRRVNELQSRLDEANRQWQALNQRYPAATTEIRRLLSQIDGQYGHIRRQWLGGTNQPGDITYEDIVQSIDALISDLYQARINVVNEQGGSQAIGIAAPARSPRWQ